MILSVEILEPFMLMEASGWFPRIGELLVLILNSQPPLLRGVVVRPVHSSPSAFIIPLVQRFGL
jgi:hypothetical protein